MEYYVIHLNDAIDRFTNIKNMENILKKDINIFSAINTNTYEGDLLKLIESCDNNLKLNYSPKYKGEIGCYLSHYLLYKQLLESKYDYTIVFEDDFIIHDDNLEQTINNLLINMNNFDFDYLFLGHSNIKGIKLVDNIYNIQNNKKVWGFHGYILNNKKIPKILNFLKNIINEIDLQIYDLIKNNDIIGYFVNPVLIRQNTFKFPSHIRITLKYNNLFLHKNKKILNKQKKSVILSEQNIKNQNLFKLNTKKTPNLFKLNNNINKFTVNKILKKI